MINWKQLVTNFKQQLLQELLLQLPQDQQDMFNNKIFPHGVSAVKKVLCGQTELDAALDLLERSVNKMYEKTPV